MFPKAFAQNLINCPNGTQADASIGCVNTPDALANSELGISELISSASQGLITVIIIICIIFMIKSGIQYSLAAGDDEKIKKAKRIFIGSTIGLILSLLAQTLGQTIINLL